MPRHRLLRGAPPITPISRRTPLSVSPRVQLGFQHVKTISSPFLHALDHGNPYLIPHAKTSVKLSIPTQYIHAFFNNVLREPLQGEESLTIKIFRSLVRFPSFWIPRPKMPSHTLYERLIWKFLVAPDDRHRNEAFKAVVALSNQGIGVSVRLSDRIVLQSQSEVSRSEDNLNKFVANSLNAIAADRYNAAILYVLMTSLSSAGKEEVAEKLFRDWGSTRGLSFPLRLKQTLSSARGRKSISQVLDRIGYDPSNTQLTNTDHLYLPRFFSILIKNSVKGEDPDLNLAYHWFVIYRLRFVVHPRHLRDGASGAKPNNEYARPYVEMLYALSRFPRQRPLKLNMVRKVRPADIIRYMLDDGFDPLSSTVLINSILSAEQELTWIYRPPWKIAHPEREPKSYIAATALLQRHAPTFAIFQLMLKDKLVPNGQTFKHVLTSRFRVRNMIEDYGIGPSAPDFIPRSPEVEAPEILNVLSLPPPFQIPVPKPRAILREMLRVRCSSHSFRSWQARMKNQSKDVWNAGIAELAIKFLIHEEDWVAAWLVAQHVRNRFRWGAPVDPGFTDDFSVHRILANLTERWTEGMVPALLDNFGSIDPNSEMGIVFEAFVTLGREHGYVEIQKLRPRAKSLLEGSKGRELLARFLRYCDPAPTGEEWHGKVEQCLKDILPVEEASIDEVVKRIMWGRKVGRRRPRNH